MHRLFLTTILLACGDSTPVEIGDNTTESAGLGHCGDGVSNAGEACDDGNGFGGDGCNERCEVEAGPFESEPNDEWSNPNDWSVPSVYGGLPEGDVDCFAIDATTT